MASGVPPEDVEGHSKLFRDYALRAIGHTLLPGRLTIKAGPLKGKSVEPGQAKFSQILKILWGAPEIYKSQNSARNGIANRSGVISFFSIEGAGGTAQGHSTWSSPTGMASTRVR